MKRVVINIVILLMLGAIVNIAVAWGCAIRWIDGPYGEVRFGSTYDETTRNLWVVDGKHWIGTSEFSVVGFNDLEDPYKYELTAEEAAPFWLNWESVEDFSDSNESYTANVISHGLPFRSLLIINDNKSSESESVLMTGIEATIPDWLKGPEPELGFRSDITYLPLKPTPADRYAGAANSWRSNGGERISDVGAILSSA